MPALVEEYNPLDYANLTRNCVQELMTREPAPLPPKESFGGAGVYALFYNGDWAPYAKVRSRDTKWPIYVGKAVPPGARKGGKKENAKPLNERLRQHAVSIQHAQTTLRIEDFSCRYLVVTPLWITMAERFLIEHYQPLWNVCFDGFGNKTPGKGRYEGQVTWWDALHPGRPWAKMLQPTRSQEQALERLAQFLAHYEQKPRDVSPTALHDSEVNEPDEDE